MVLVIVTSNGDEPNHSVVLIITKIALDPADFKTMLNKLRRRLVN